MYRRLLVLALATFAVGTDSLVIAGVLPEVAGSPRVSSSAAGRLITAYALAYAVYSWVAARRRAREARRLTAFPQTRTSCQAPALLGERS